MKMLLYTLKSASILFETIPFDSNFLSPCRMAAIFDFVHNAMFKLLSGYTCSTLFPRATLRGVAELHIASGMP